MSLVLTIPPEKENEIIQKINEFLTGNPIIVDNVIQHVLSTQGGGNIVTEAVRNRVNDAGFSNEIKQHFSSQVELYLQNSDQFKELVADKIHEVAEHEISEDDISQQIRDVVSEMIGERQFTRQIESRIDDAVTEHVDNNVTISQDDIESAVQTKIDSEVTAESIHEKLGEKIDEIDINEQITAQMSTVLTQMGPEQLVKDSMQDACSNMVEAIFQTRSLEDRFNETLKEWIRQCLPLKFIEYVAENNIKDDIKTVEPATETPSSVKMEIISNVGMGGQARQIFDLSYPHFTIVSKLIIALGGKEIPCQNQ